VRLRRTAVGGPGVRRIRRGRGFSYLEADGTPATEPDTLSRIEELVIPPAWKSVWICPYPNGHIQAVGTDAAGRKQYLYHQRWQQERAEEKYDRTLRLAKRLPDWRIVVVGDLRGRGLHCARVLAVAHRLLDRGYFRAGGEEYAQENGSFGLATLRREHVRVRRDSVEFDYPAKSGVQRSIELEDPLVVRAVRALLRAEHRLARLLVYRNDEGDWSRCAPTASTPGFVRWSATSTASRTCAPGTAPCWPQRRSRIRPSRRARPPASAPNRR